MCSLAEKQEIKARLTGEKKDPGRDEVTERKGEGEKGPTVDVGRIRVDGDVSRSKGSLGKIDFFFFFSFPPGEGRQ